MTTARQPLGSTCFSHERICDLLPANNRPDYSLFYSRWAKLDQLPRLRTSLCRSFAIGCELLKHLQHTDHACSWTRALAPHQRPQLGQLLLCVWTHMSSAILHCLQQNFPVSSEAAATPSQTCIIWLLCSSCTNLSRCSLNSKALRCGPLSQLALTHLHKTVGARESVVHPLQCRFNAVLPDPIDSLCNTSSSASIAALGVSLCSAPSESVRSLQLPALVLDSTPLPVTIQLCTIHSLQCKHLAQQLPHIAVPLPQQILCQRLLPKAHLNKGAGLAL